MDVDRELMNLRELDAMVLAGLHLTPDQPRAPGHRFRHELGIRVYGIRGSMKRLERRGYLEPGWKVDYMGARCQVTDVGKRVAGAVAAVLLAGSYADDLGKSPTHARLGARFRRLRA